ncbi:MAG: Gfo/Idh/MocA family oxidoreductase [Balneolaceae bacterium]
MNSNRRDFLKTTGLMGLGMSGASLLGGCGSGNGGDTRGEPIYNMRGYAAEPLETVRIGVLGIGNRGFGALRRLMRIEGVELMALADLDPTRLEMAGELLSGTDHNPETYTGEEDWKRICERDDIDLIYICTPWHLHTPNAVHAMQNGKHAATEVPAAQTIEECWQLVNTSEETRRHCMMLENVCYDFFEMVTLKMAREGFFGELIHGEGAYIHELTRGLTDPDRRTNWRMHENIGRHGNLYPMHGLGSVAQAMDLNCGDRAGTLISMSSNDFSVGPWVQKQAETNDQYAQLVDADFRGNMNTSVMRTERGRTIMLQHDTSSPRPYSRIHLLSGTEGVCRKYPLPARIATGHDGWLTEEEQSALEEQFTPEITRRAGEMARQVGGHGGMDTLMDWRLVDCLRNGLPLDMDVYDAALWSSVIPLSEASVADRSNPQSVPDFTRGDWMRNSRGMDLDLRHGGTTRIL